MVCLIDPVGDVYACPFASRYFLAGNVLSDGGFQNVWKNSSLFREAPEPDPQAPVAALRTLRLPGRLHGGEILHRPAAGQADPGLRARP